MADNIVSMEIPAVMSMSERFNQIGGVLKDINNALEVCMTILQTTAFIGLVGGTAVARYLETLQPVIEKFSEKSLELSTDLKAAAEAFERGDGEGATKFH